MNKKILLGMAGTAIFAVVFLMGKAITAKAEEQDKPQSRLVGMIKESIPLYALTDRATRGTCCSIGAGDNLSCVH